VPRFLLIVLLYALLTRAGPAKELKAAFKTCKCGEYAKWFPALKALAGRGYCVAPLELAIVLQRYTIPAVLDEVAERLAKVFHKDAVQGPDAATEPRRRNPRP